jgi:sensor histidine kinase YesM
MEAMAKLFRHIIRNKEIIVPLRHEIEGLEFYFYILKVRFPKNLDLALDYDSALLDACRVPVSILQPLVENCVIHAFRDSPGPEGKAAVRNQIHFRAEKQESRLVLTVRDNGCGINAEQVEKLLHPLTLDESSMSRVMGLENVIQRLYFFYPQDPQVVDIQSTPGQGTAVIISIDTGREPCIAF